MASLQIQLTKQFVAGFPSVLMLSKHNIGQGLPQPKLAALIYFPLPYQ